MSNHYHDMILNISYEFGARLHRKKEIRAFLPCGLLRSLDTPFYAEGSVGIFSIIVFITYT